MILKKAYHNKNQQKQNKIQHFARTRWVAVSGGHFGAYINMLSKLTYLVAGKGLKEPPFEKGT